MKANATLQLKGHAHIACVKGQVWVTIVSATGPQSVCPLIDVLLRPGQTYHALSAIVSTFEESVIIVVRDEP
jgi:hypothetical protein